MNKYEQYLDENDFYSKKRIFSFNKIEKLKSKMSNIFCDKVSIFVVGSIGREEVGEKSDLDLFIIAKEKVSKLEEYNIFYNLIKINKELGFPDFSNDGQYLTIHYLNDLKKTIGSPFDDSLNLFTTRMLLLLESKVIFNEELYNEIIKSIIKNYLRDKKNNSDNFLPFYLLNDILRYWRTLCLNYEVIRHNKEKPWRKKNINLKYSRMITVFSAILSIVVQKNLTTKKIIKMCKLTPFKRISHSLNTLNDNSLYEKYVAILDYYKIFLEAKENSNIEKNNEIQTKLNENATLLSDILLTFLNNDNIDSKLKKLLVI